MTTDLKKSELAAQRNAKKEGKKQINKVYQQQKIAERAATKVEKVEEMAQDLSETAAEALGTAKESSSELSQLVATNYRKLQMDIANSLRKMETVFKSKTAAAKAKMKGMKKSGLIKMRSEVS